MFLYISIINQNEALDEQSMLMQKSVRYGLERIGKCNRNVLVLRGRKWVTNGSDPGKVDQISTRMLRQIPAISPALDDTNLTRRRQQSSPKPSLPSKTAWSRRDQPWQNPAQIGEISFDFSMPSPGICSSHRHLQFLTNDHQHKPLIKFIVFGARSAAVTARWSSPPTWLDSSQPEVSILGFPVIRSWFSATVEW